MQSVVDTDFEIEAKFDSTVSQAYQIQGILVETDPNNFIRFDYYSDGSQTYIFAASFIGGSPTVRVNQAIANTSPLFLRVGRVGDQWTYSYSTDGVNFSSAATFNHTTTVTEVGLFAGNAAGSPAHTALVDYLHVVGGGSSGPDTTAPTLSNVQVSTTETSATISWTTSEAADSSVAYGATSAYENGSVDDTNLVISHSITLIGLSASTQYHYEASSTDGSANTGFSGDLVFTTDDPGAPAGNVTADDFNGAFDTGLWTFVDPVGDSSASTNGSQLEISVPGGTSHDLWTSGNDSARVMQSVVDDDFEIEAKFDSTVSQAYQIQGILVETDPNNFIRFDYYSNGSQTYIFATSFENGSPTVRVNQVIANTSPLFLRVGRVGNQWTYSYSSDGTNFTNAVTFNHITTVTSVGVFAGNAAGSNPAHTALVDYFHVL